MMSASPIKMNLGWSLWNKKSKIRLIRWLDRFYLECLQNIEPELIFFFKQIKLAHPSFGLSNSLYWISVFRILRNLKKGQLDKNRKNGEFWNEIVALFEIFESNSPFCQNFTEKRAIFDQWSLLQTNSIMFFGVRNTFLMIFCVLVWTAICLSILPHS